jgi:hypothetical protein
VRRAGVRCYSQRRQRCAVTKAKQRVPAPRGGQPIGSAAYGTPRGRSLLPWMAKDQTMALAGPGIRRMSASRRS